MARSGNRNPNPASRFQKGQSGNPAGQSSERQKLRERFVSDLYAEWLKRGAEALQSLDAKGLVTAAADAAGKDVNVNHGGTVAHAHDHLGLSETGRLIGESLASGRTLPEPVSH